MPRLPRSPWPKKKWYTIKKMPQEGLEPPRCYPPGSKPGASANSATAAKISFINFLWAVQDSNLRPAD